MSCPYKTGEIKTASLTCKVLEGVVNSAFKQYFLTNSPLTNVQFGFHQNNSDPDLIRTMPLIYRCAMIVTSLDVKAALDSRLASRKPAKVECNEHQRKKILQCIVMP